MLGVAVVDDESRLWAAFPDDRHVQHRRDGRLYVILEVGGDDPYLLRLYAFIGVILVVLLEFLVVEVPLFGGVHRHLGYDIVASHPVDSDLVAQFDGDIVHAHVDANHLLLLFFLMLVHFVVEVECRPSALQHGAELHGGRTVCLGRIAIEDVDKIAVSFRVGLRAASVGAEGSCSQVCSEASDHLGDAGISICVGRDTLQSAHYQTLGRNAQVVGKVGEVVLLHREDMVVVRQLCIVGRILREGIVGVFSVLFDGVGIETMDGLIVFHAVAGIGRDVKRTAREVLHGHAIIAADLRGLGAAGQADGQLSIIKIEELAAAVGCANHEIVE